MTKCGKKASRNATKMEKICSSDRKRSDANFNTDHWLSHLLMDS